MKKIATISIIITLLIIIGCSNKKVIEHDHSFKGENELWTAEYKVNGTGTFTETKGKTKYDSNCSKVLTVTYKKDISELDSVKYLEISYESTFAKGNLISNFNENDEIEKTYTLKSGGTGVAIENKDEIVKVNINLDGSVQTIELKNE